MTKLNTVTLTIAAAAVVFLGLAVQPVSAQGTLFVEGNNVGIGDATPSDLLDIDVQGSNGGVMIESAVDGNLPQFTLSEPSRTWRFRVANNGSFVFTDATNGSAPVVMRGGAVSNLLLIGGTNTLAADPDRITVNGELFVGGSMVTPDYVFEPDFQLETIDEHAEYMWSQKHLPAVGGAMVMDGKHYVNVEAHQFGMLEELEKAHIYIDQLNQKVEDLEARLATLEDNSRDQ